MVRKHIRHETTRGGRWRWAMVSLVVTAVGCVLTVMSARDDAHDADAARTEAFDRSALEITTSLQGAIAHESDLVVSTAAVFGVDPELATADLSRWLTSVRVGERYPEVAAVAVLRFVPANELADFVSRLRRDPAVTLNAEGGLVVEPAGQRPFYCLLQAVVALDGNQTVADQGLDYCASEVGPLILAARDTGTPSYLAVPSPTGTQLVVQAPIYAGGEDPGSSAVRRVRYLGSLGTSISPEVLFDAVLKDNPDATITLSYTGSTSSASFTNAPTPEGGRTARYDLGGGWSATVSMPGWSSSVWSSRTALQVLIAGCAGTVTFGLLILVLGTSRQRALRLVARRTDELNHQALHDALTDLPNRTLILDRAEQLLARGRRNGHISAALYLDLDGFKSVNDTLGHDAGDQLLRAVTARLITSLRDVDTIGRMGGDEFVVLVDGGNLQIGPELVAERVIEVLRQPFELDRAARPVRITTSVGIAIGDRPTAGDLLRDADIALYRAKESGRDRFEVFRPEMETAVQHQFELEADLRVALEHHQFRLFYQPIYNLSDLTLIGAEALIRWEHPTKGMLQPDEFIPRLEASGQIVEVGRWVLLEACRQAAAWRELGHTLSVSVNISARQLDTDAIVDHVAEAIDLSGIDPGHLTLEITETALMKDTDLAAERLHALKALGVQIAIDDFGTGYSSLAYLQQFPVDCLKIDRSFTEAITRTRESDALVQTLVQLGKDLGLSTLAEGVETTGQLDYLRGAHVDEAQGFLLARPLAAADFDAKLLPQAAKSTHHV